MCGIIWIKIPCEVDEMKKFIFGLLVGVTITAAGTAYADEISNVIGKTIQGQYPVKIEGKQLSTQAVVVDGTSYLPVRAVGEALDMDVKFNADLGIELTEKGGTKVEVTPKPVDAPEQSNSEENGQQLVDTTLPKDKQIAYLKDEIIGIETMLPGLKLTLSKWDPSTNSSKELAKTIADNESRLAAMKALLEELQK
jgi:hypothetical protein